MRHPGIAAAHARSKRELSRRLRTHLGQAKGRGELRVGVDCTKMANILVGMLRGLIVQSPLEGDAARLAANRAQIYAFINIGLCKRAEDAEIRAFATRRRTA